MATLPLIRDTSPGLYQALVNANTDYVVAVPAGATGVILWFEDVNAVMVRGRIGIDQANTAVSGLTGTDGVLGYHPPVPVEYTLRTRQDQGRTVNAGDRYLHLASGTAGTIVRGSWLFADDDEN